MKEKEISNNLKRSKLWYDIYSIVKQIPREKVKEDAMDYLSASTELEKLFKKYNKII